MEFQFADFDTAHFRSEPRRTVIGPWTIGHHSFAAPATAARPPLVFIGGAFQNAWSFLREVKHFISQRPVILVDLPGQGQNNQLSEGLSFGDFATLLKRFLDEHHLNRIIPVGLSYGSGIAYTFAQQFPERVERLILGGTTEQIRVRVDRALRSSFWYLDQGREDAFASAVIHHLLNLPHRDVTRVSDRLIESMRAGMLALSDTERLRYRHNSTRLFSDRLNGRLSCRTMVFTAKYDHFTAPYEALSIAQKCDSVDFVMIERGDHLAPVQNPRSVIALYDAFLNDVPLSNIEGVVTGSAAFEACKERRVLPRRAGRGRDVTLSGPSGREFRAALIDYNAHGCLVQTKEGAALAAEEGPAHISIPSIGANGDAVVLPDERGVRAIFLHDAFGTLGTMPVMTVEMPSPSIGSRVSIAQRIVELGEH